MSKIKKYNATTEQWETIDNGVVDAVKSNTTDRMTVSEEEPENPKKGDVWVNTADPLIPDRSITGDKIALNTVKSENVDFATFGLEYRLHSYISLNNQEEVFIPLSDLFNEYRKVKLIGTFIVDTDFANYVSRFGFQSTDNRVDNNLFYAQEQIVGSTSITAHIRQQSNVLGGSLPYITRYRCAFNIEFFSNSRTDPSAMFISTGGGPEHTRTATGILRKNSLYNGTLRFGADTTPYPTGGSRIMVYVGDPY